MKSFGEIRDSNLERDIFLNRVILGVVAIFLMESIRSRVDG